MDYTLIRYYDDPDTDRHGGFGVERSRDVADIYDTEHDFRIYVAM